MSYLKNNWDTDDTITTDKLNNMVDGTTIPPTVEGTIKGNVTFDDGVIENKITAYMDNHPVSATVVDDSVTFKKLAKETKDYIGYNNDTLLSDKSMWVAKKKVTCAYNAKLESVDRQNNDNFITTVDIPITSDENITINSDVALIVIAIRENFADGFLKSADTESLSIDVKKGNKVAICIECAASYTDTNVDAAVANANIIITHESIIDKVYKEQDIKPSGYYANHKNMVNPKECSKGFSLNYNNGLIQVMDDTCFTTTAIPVEEGETYVLMTSKTGGNMVWYISAFDADGTFVHQLEKTRIETVQGGASTVTIPINYKKLSISAFEDGLDYYTYDSETSLYTKVESTETFDSTNEYYVHNPIAFARATAAKISSCETFCIYKGNASIDTFPTYEIMDYEPTTEFKQMIKSVVDEANGASDIFGLNYLAYGDSQTSGYNSGNVSYVNYVAQNLKCSTFKNLGLPSSRFAICPIGDKTDSDQVGYSISSKLETTATKYLNYASYDIITLAGGINDAWAMKSGHLQLGDYDTALTDYNAGTFKADDFYHAMFKACYYLRYLFAGKRIGIITPPRTEFTDEFDKVEEAMIKVAHRFSIPVYISSQMDGLNVDMTDFSPTWTADRLHPNQDYNKIRGRKIAAWIKTL